MLHGRRGRRELGDDERDELGEDLEEEKEGESEREKEKEKKEEEGEKRCFERCARIDCLCLLSLSSPRSSAGAKMSERSIRLTCSSCSSFVSARRVRMRSRDSISAATAGEGAAMSKRRRGRENKDSREE